MITRETITRTGRESDLSIHDIIDAACELLPSNTTPGQARAIVVLTAEEVALWQPRHVEQTLGMSFGEYVVALEGATRGPVIVENRRTAERILSAARVLAFKRATVSALCRASEPKDFQVPEVRID